MMTLYREMGASGTSAQPVTWRIRGTLKFVGHELELGVGGMTAEKSYCQTVQRLTQPFSLNKGVTKLGLVDNPFIPAQRTQR